MRKTKAVKKQAVKRIAKVISKERERVLYSFDSKNKTVKASFAKTNKSIVITALQVKELSLRLNDLKRFYSYCNADIKLLSRLHADAQAKKQHEIINTQYDSRKKLFALLQQVTLTKLKQKSKAKHSKVKK